MAPSPTTTRPRVNAAGITARAVGSWRSSLIIRVVAVGDEVGGGAAREVAGADVRPAGGLHPAVVQDRHLGQFDADVGDEQTACGGPGSDGCRSHGVNEQHPRGREYPGHDPADRVLLRHGGQHRPANDRDGAGRDGVAVPADQLGQHDDAPRPVQDASTAHQRTRRAEGVAGRAAHAATAGHPHLRTSAAEVDGYRRGQGRCARPGLDGAARPADRSRVAGRRPPWWARTCRPHFRRVRLPRSRHRSTACERAQVATPGSRRTSVPSVQPACVRRRSCSRTVRIRRRCPRPCDAGRIGCHQRHVGPPPGESGPIPVTLRRPRLRSTEGRCTARTPDVADAPSDPR